EQGAARRSSGHRPACRPAGAGVRGGDRRRAGAGDAVRRGRPLPQPPPATGRFADQRGQESEEATAVVRALETQYDAAAGSISRGSLLATESLPSGEELSAQVEQFLADLDRDDGPESESPA